MLSAFSISKRKPHKDSNWAGKMKKTISEKRDYERQGCKKRYTKSNVEKLLKLLFYFEKNVCTV